MPRGTRRQTLWQQRHGVGAIPHAAAPDSLGAAPVPVPREPSLILRAADGGFTRSHRYLFGWPKARGFGGVGSEPRPPEERSHAGTPFAESVGSDERRDGGLVTRRRLRSERSPRSSRDATLAWLTVNRVSGAWRGGVC